MRDVTSLMKASCFLFFVCRKKGKVVKKTGEKNRRQGIEKTRRGERQ